MSHHLPLPSRARRRQDRTRVVARALAMFRRVHRDHYPPAHRPHDHKVLADNLAHCAGVCCRNPRRTTKGADRLPWQEVRARQRVDGAAGD